MKEVRKLTDREKEAVDRLKSIFSPPKPESYKAIIEITEGDDEDIILECQELYDCDLFDGNYLKDNITEENTIPTEVGVYECEIWVHSYRSNHPLDPEEWDCNLWIENPIRIDLRN